MSGRLTAVASESRVLVSCACRMFAWLLAVSAVEVHAADQAVDLQYDKPLFPLESLPEDTFRDRFKVAFDQRAGGVFADRFHLFNVMNWELEQANNKSDDLRERAGSAARSALSRSVVYGIREAAVDLPILLWLKERQGLLAEFLRNSLDSVGEEAVAPLDVSYRAVERSWWQGLSDSGGQLRYGIRPFRTDPYAFLSLGIKDGDNLLFLGHLRYHYDKFADHRFEIALSVPLAHGLAIDLGTSYQFGRHRDKQGLVIKLFKEFKSGGIVHVGLEARQHPAVFAGIVFPW